MSSVTSHSTNGQFSPALVKLVADAAKIPPVIDHPRIKEDVRAICEILRIEKCIGSVLRKGYFDNKEIGSITFKDGGNADEERIYEHRDNIPDGNVAIYNVYPAKGAEDWSEQEMADIESFLSALFVINGRARMVEVMEHIAFCDRELEVYNLNYVLRALGRLINDGGIMDYCACRFNLKNFASVNAKIGRENGTALMKRFALKMADLLGDNGIIARLGGDNFIALFKKEMLDAVRVYLIGTDIETGFRGLPELNISAYTGYLMMTEEYPTIHHIMERLDTAYTMAKYKLKIPYVMFDERFKAERDNIKTVETLFYDAIDNEEFLVYYQPKVDLKDYRIYGAEALCRWKRGDEILSPGMFIPALEQSNNICILDFYMLDHVCRDIRRWLDKGYQVLKISVNMSRVHLGDQRLSETIKDIIDKYNVPHEYIEIELTETTTDVDFAELKNIVGPLHRDGISTSVDDFGVGYSSLNLIRDLPWNVLKLDKSFLPDDKDENRYAKRIMLRHVISMAHQLGLECIAEGVETIEQVELLKDYNCYCAQGFLFDKPLPADVFEKRITENSIYSTS